MKYLKKFEEHIGRVYKVEGQGLEQLPELLEGIVLLDCKNNRLKNLPKLPSTLTDLYCTNNSLAFLPELPNGLKYLFCDDNLLQYLPTLPDSLGMLVCDKNYWKEPIKYEYTKKFDLRRDVYTNKQYLLFQSFEFQKEFLHKNPSRYEDFIPFGYAEGIKELFSHIFSAHDLGL